MSADWQESRRVVCRWALAAGIAAGVAPVAIARGGEPGRDPRVQSEQVQVEGQGGRDGVNPVRELEAEIEDYPTPSDSIADEEKTRIPEAIDTRARSGQPAPAAPGSRRAPAPIERSEVERVMGRDARLLDLGTLDVAQVTLLQQRLRERGHYLGRIDGVAGPQTRAAVLSAARERFQLARRLLQQGQVTSDLAAMIGISGVTPIERDPAENVTPRSP